ncbi:MAG: hypothetical protein H6865_03270 [Rhodospirillales bacterium]|nr:hypothetical protein [Alphaproteobacteria bacterium]MCB9986639.1 hypothetical protein [Rhodospirillales bacterium]USO06832.1 MAG: hypothetical protein H6866_05115 [Rhodospirillales bacterium]
MNLRHAFLRAVHEYPMKIYPLIFMTADMLTGLHGTNGKGSLIWSVSAGLGVLGHGLKLAFGKGGEKIPEGTIFAKGQLKAFFTDFGQYTIRPFQPSYWHEMQRVYANLDPVSIAGKIKHTLQPWRYPLDTGYMLFALAGLGYLADSANIFGLRENGSTLQFALATTVTMGSVTGFTTNRNDLAGSLYALGTVLALSAGIAAQSWPLTLSAPVYLAGNYLLSRVRTDHQSEYVSAQTAAAKPSAP